METDYRALGCGASLAERLRLARPDLGPILDDAPRWRAQILLSSWEGRGPLRQESFRADAEYFYPASTMKLHAAIAAMAMMRDLRAGRRVGGTRIVGRGGAWLGLDVPWTIHPMLPGESPRGHDPTNLGVRAGAPGTGRITLRHLLRQIFLVSDNPAFNALVDLVGPHEITRRMRAAGLGTFDLRHRLSETRTLPTPDMTAGITLSHGRRSLRVMPRDGGGLAPPREDVRGLAGILVGRGFVRDGVVEPGPTDFSIKNRCSLADLHATMLMLAGAPGYARVGQSRRDALGLSARDRRTLLLMMAELPGDSPSPRYDRREYPDDFGKPMLAGVRAALGFAWDDGRVLYANKMGQAYGFTIENAWLRLSPRRGGRSRCVVVSAVIESNEDGLLNSDRYAYERIARPFFDGLGRVVARELLGG